MSDDIDCPFCTGRVNVNEDMTQILHTVPLCRRFRNMDPLEFVIEANNEYARRCGPEGVAMLRKIRMPDGGS